jgi:hypothetical protein
MELVQLEGLPGKGSCGPGHRGCSHHHRVRGGRATRAPLA